MLAPPCILIIDDEERLAGTMAACLTDEGYEAVICNDATKALAAIEQHDPDLVLLDVVMPEISGWELLTAIRLEPHLARLPIIIMTGGVDFGRAEYRRRQPAHTHFLPKPFDLQEMLFAVEMFLHPHLHPPQR